MTVASSIAIVRGMGEQTISDKLRRYANQMGEYDVRRPVLREAATLLEAHAKAAGRELAYPSALAEALGAPPQHGAFNCRGDYRLPSGDKIKAEDLGIEPSYGAGEPLAPLISSCGLCNHEGPRVSNRCPECSERW